MSTLPQFIDLEKKLGSNNSYIKKIESLMDKKTDDYDSYVDLEQQYYLKKLKSVFDKYKIDIMVSKFGRPGHYSGSPIMSVNLLIIFNTVSFGIG